MGAHSCCTGVGNRFVFDCIELIILSLDFGKLSLTKILNEFSAFPCSVACSDSGMPSLFEGKVSSSMVKENDGS